MKLKNMLANMEYCGEVAAPKRHYTVLRNRTGYVLCSQKTYAIWEGDFVIVKTAAVEYLARRLKGQTGLTAKVIRDRTRKSPHAAERFDVLNGMYVLLALGRAKIDTRFKQRAIHFNVKG
jgi:hypothetical protein